MEGTGRPVSDILSSLRPVKDPVTLVVCCVFDDPWLAADYVLCRERTRAVVEGSAIVGRASRAVRIIFAVSRGERELGTMLLTEAESFGIPAAMVLVSSRYPQRNRRELDLVLKKYGKRESLELGYILPLGPATLAAIHDAVKLKKSILSRYIAVGGSAVKKAQVMRVRIGTRIGEVFAECGGFIDKPGRIIAGSPLMGQAVADLDEPVIKTTYALFAVKGKQNRTVPGNCMGCGECRLVCPVGLDPEELFKMNGFQGSGRKAAECHGCGCCDVVCPARIPLGFSIVSSACRGE
jgi:electron transport complex protein RnfC